MCVYVYPSKGSTMRASFAKLKKATISTLEKYRYSWRAELNSRRRTVYIYGKSRSCYNETLPVHRGARSSSYQHPSKPLLRELRKIEDGNKSVQYPKNRPQINKFSEENIRQQKLQLLLLKPLVVEGVRQNFVPVLVLKRFFWPDDQKQVRHVLPLHI